jgi:hypothetical protein
VAKRRKQNCSNAFAADKSEMKAAAPFRVVQPYGRDVARESTLISEHVTARRQLSLTWIVSIEGWTGRAAT